MIELQAVNSLQLEIHPFYPPLHIAYFGKLNELMGDIEIQTKSHSRNDNIVLLHMVMTFHMKAKPKGKMEVDYLCKVTLDDNGLLTEVVEYWDASPFLEAIPLLGQVIKLTRKLTRAKLAT